mmetsp:Transcript_69650/g.167157  ORF Transcript_69650/g.167157 Transcript_69650/m.167157 type:complete len:234 (+) Transcript_69650:148-849(+)
MNSFAASAKDVLCHKLCKPFSIHGRRAARDTFPFIPQGLEIVLKDFHRVIRRQNVDYANIVEISPINRKQTAEVLLMDRQFTTCCIVIALCHLKKSSAPCGHVAYSWRGISRVVAVGLHDVLDVYILLNLVNADQQRVVNDILVPQELGIELDLLHQLLLVLCADVDDFLLVLEVHILQSDRLVCLILCFAANPRSLQVIPSVDLKRRIEHVAHDHKVHLSADDLALASFSNA